MKYTSIVIMFVLACLFCLSSCFGMMRDRVIAVDDSNFEETVLKNEKPVLLFFYWKKKTSQYDQIFSAMNKFNTIAEDEVVFAKYCMQDGIMDEKYGVKNDAMCIRFENGQDVSKEGLADIKTNKALGSGQMFLMLKDIIEPKLDFSFHNKDIEYILKKDFDDKVLSAEKPVLINFTALNTSCSIVKSCAGDFATAAATYGQYADFYYIDVDGAGNKELLEKYNVRKIPSVVSFYRGNEKIKSQKTYKSPYNDAQFFGMILPYINTKH